MSKQLFTSLAAFLSAAATLATQFATDSPEAAAAPAGPTGDTPADKPAATRGRPPKSTTPPPAEETKETRTWEDLKAICAPLIKEGGKWKDGVVKLIKDAGAETFSKMKPSDFPIAFETAEALAKEFNDFKAVSSELD